MDAIKNVIPTMAIQQFAQNNSHNNILRFCKHHAGNSSSRFNANSSIKTFVAFVILT
jgi:hypothetical protein